jgi:hypothetical protein
MVRAVLLAEVEAQLRGDDFIGKSACPPWSLDQMAADQVELAETIEELSSQVAQLRHGFYDQIDSEWERLAPQWLKTI